MQQRALIVEPKGSISRVESSLLSEAGGDYTGNGVAVGDGVGPQASSLRDLVQNELIALGRTPAVVKEWSAIAAEFEHICGYKTEYARPDVMAFVKHLRQRGLCQNTILKDIKTLKVIARVQGWTFPVLPLESVPDHEVDRPAFEREYVISLIQIGKRLLLPEYLALLALSTIYGVRREEMARLKPEDFTAETVTIHTAKKERTITHLIPPEIAPYLKQFKPYARDTLSHVFHKMMLAMGFRTKRGFGWHAIRRTLTEELILTETSALNLMRFMRWSEKTIQREFGMLALYSRRVTKQQPRIDEEIFKIHPFLPYWRD